MVAPRRILAVSPDRAFAEHLAIALRAAGGEVEVERGLDGLGPGALQVALCVVHCAGELADPITTVLPRLAGDCRVIAVLPRVELAAVVAIMQASERVAGVMFAERFDPRALSGLAVRALTGDVFGLDKLIAAPGIQTRQVADYHDKSLCMAEITELIAQVGVPRKYHESIEQCIDEMIMNALYDAPVDDDGNSILSEVPTRARIGLRTDHIAVVQYGYDGKQFGVSVRDTFGSLTRGAVLGVLHKCLFAGQQIDERAGGAGVGLYLMINSATTVSFNVVPGMATEVVCTFDVEAPTLQLEQLAMLVERFDVTGKLTVPLLRSSRVGLRPIERSLEPASEPDGGRSSERGVERPVAPGWSAARRRVLAALAIAAVAAVAAVGAVVAWPRLRGANDAPAAAAAPVAAAPAAPVATVEVGSEPSGASVEVNGQPFGTTPLALTTPAPGTELAIVLKRPGYRDARARLKMPALGHSARVFEQLELSDDAVRVRFVSAPPGAQVIPIGQLATGADRTYTPAELLLEAGKRHHFMLTMPGRVPLLIEPFTLERGARAVEKGGALVAGVTLRIEAPGDGRATVAGAPHCKDASVPVECTLAPGSYAVELVSPDTGKQTRTVKLADKDATVRFEPR